VQEAIELVARLDALASVRDLIRVLAPA
jgi:hypothetical protein